jgi:hypothetical protein
MNITSDELKQCQEFLSDCNYHTEAMMMQAFYLYVNSSNCFNSRVEEFLTMIEILEKINKEHTENGLTEHNRIIRNSIESRMLYSLNDYCFRKPKQNTNLLEMTDKIHELFTNWTKEGKPSHWKTGLKHF